MEETQPQEDLAYWGEHGAVFRSPQPEGEAPLAQWEKPKPVRRRS